MGQSNYNTTDRDEAIKNVLTPEQVSLYITADATGIAIAQDVDTKIVVDVTPSILPNGFDLYVTPQGSAIRYIGSGLGNGDSGDFLILVHISVATTSGSATATIKCKTRPYTETDFANAEDCPGAFVRRKLVVNDHGAFAIVAPIETLTDGDLLELAINPDSGVTITIDSLAVTMLKVK